MPSETLEGTAPKGAVALHKFDAQCTDWPLCCACCRHGLITYDECDKSTTTEAQAAAFWTVDAAAGSPARPAPPTQHDDDDDVLDDMD